MNETLSWSYEWNLIVWTNWIMFPDTHFTSWNISTLFFRNKNFKIVKEKFHRISPPLNILLKYSECKHCKIFKVCLTILHNKNIKSYDINRSLRKAVWKYPYITLKNGSTYLKNILIVNILAFLVCLTIKLLKFYDISRAVKKAVLKIFFVN